MLATNDMTSPAMSPWTIGVGIHAAMWRVRPTAAATNTIAPASREAPESSAKVN